jgi:hypothetical protein
MGGRAQTRSRHGWYYVVRGRRAVSLADLELEKIYKK